MKILPILLASLLACAALAQTSDDETGEPPANETAAEEKDPFKVNVGFDLESKAITATMKGSRLYFDEKRVYDPAEPGFNPWKAWFAEVTTDARWASAEEAHNQASISLRPGIMRWFSERVVRDGVEVQSDTLNHLEIYGDIRQKYGEFENEEATEANDFVKVNQTLTGVGVDWAFAGRLVKWLAAGHEDAESGDPFGDNTITSRLDPTPYVSIRYYHVIDTSGVPQKVAEGIEVDKVVAQLKGDLTLPFRVKSGSFRLLFDLSATYPTDGVSSVESFQDIGIALQTSWLKNIGAKPIIRYTSGENEGFDFDKQVLLGLLWDFVSERL